MKVLATDRISPQSAVWNADGLVLAAVMFVHACHLHRLAPDRPMQRPSQGFNCSGAEIWIAWFSHSFAYQTNYHYLLLYCHHGHCYHHHYEHYGFSTSEIYFNRNTPNLALCLHICMRMSLKISTYVYVYIYVYIYCMDIHIYKNNYVSYIYLYM